MSRSKRYEIGDVPDLGVGLEAYAGATARADLVARTIPYDHLTMFSRSRGNLRPPLEAVETVTAAIGLVTLNPLFYFRISLISATRVGSFRNEQHCELCGVARLPTISLFDASPKARPACIVIAYALLTRSEASGGSQKVRAKDGPGSTMVTCAILARRHPDAIAAPTRVLLMRGAAATATEQTPGLV